MNYTRLLQDAWSITWRYRFLWVLGLFSGSGAVTCSSPNLNWVINLPVGRERTTGPTNFEPVIRWLAENAALIIAVVIALFLLGLFFLIVSLIAQGGMAKATADLAVGSPSSLGQAINDGIRLFWRFLGLWLLIAAVTIIIALIFAAIIGIGVGLGSLMSEGVRVVLTVLGVLFGIFAAFIAVALSIIIGIIAAYAKRAIAVDDLGIISAIRSAAILFRDRLGTSLLVWLIGLVVSIGTGIIMGILAFIVALPLISVGIILYLVAHFTAPTIIYIVLASLLLFAVVWLLSAIINTYFWNYWTIAYLRLTGRAEPTPNA